MLPEMERKRPDDPVKEESAKAGLQLNDKKTKIMITEELRNFNVNNGEIEMVKDCAYLGSIINSKGVCSQEIQRRLRLGRAAMKELKKVIKCEDISLENKAKTIHTIVYPVTMKMCESWAVKTADEKKMDVFETRCWRRAL
ncbi:Intracisternal A-particle Pol-related polyprotein [Varanus komodoensis]|nr:Intracisternal A-particle Pol-related polyprotein [Varanus komodoensis]